MIVDPDFFDHWRTRMLVDLLDGDEVAPVYLLRLWAHCQQRRSDRFEMPAAGLKAVCRAKHDPAVLESAMSESGWVTRDGRVLIAAKWSEYNSKLIAAWDNGDKGGRPPTKLRSGNKNNPTETQQEPTPNPTETQNKPNRNPPITQPEPKTNPRVSDKSREEKSREEKNEIPPTPQEGGEISLLQKSQAGSPNQALLDQARRYHDANPTFFAHPELKPQCDTLLWEYKRETGTPHGIGYGAEAILQAHLVDGVSIQDLRTAMRAYVAKLRAKPKLDPDSIFGPARFFGQGEYKAFIGAEVAEPTDRVKQTKLMLAALKASAGQEGGNAN